jgi:site-specific recombinase XerD
LVEVAPRPDENPVLVYLARLAEGESRRTMEKALATFTAPRDPETIAWGTLRYPHVTLAKSQLAARLAPATVNKILAGVRGVAREAMRLDLLAPEHFARIREVKGVRGSRLPAGRHVEVDELDGLFGVCEAETPRVVRDRAILAVLRATGCRRAELVGYDLEDLDRKAWTLFTRGKGNKERNLPAVAAQEAVLPWLRVRGNVGGPLFFAVRKDGTLSSRRMHPSSVAFIIDRTAVAADVAHLSPHDLRRTFVGDLLDGGADMATVQRLAGHESVDTTARYDRRPERAAQAAAALITIPSVRRKSEEGPQ